MAPDVRKKYENDSYPANPVPADGFVVSLDELKSLMQNRGQEGISRLEIYGGVEGLCKKLKTDPSNGKCCCVELKVCFHQTQSNKNVTFRQLAKSSSFASSYSMLSFTCLKTVV